MKGKAVFKTSVTLAVVAAICTAAVAFTYESTRERIAANARALLERSLEPALGGMPYDGELTGSELVVEPPHDLPGPGPAVIYRVFADDKPVAALFVVTATDGYSGPIRFVLGIDTNGRVTGLRILEHRETPGLGDGIDSSRSDWVDQFAGRGLGDPDIGRWAIRADGGDFDQLTGASITPRAVIQAIRDTLVYFDANRQEVFAPVSAEQDR